MMSNNTSPISITTTTSSNTNTNTNTNSSNKNNNNISRTANGGTTPACASCKYQRRKCDPDCILAPYFPHDCQRQFLNAHKLFGVRKITKIIENLVTQAHKDEAMRSIIFQSDVRANDPVGGCYRIVLELQRQINYAQADLDLLLHHLAIYQQQQQQKHHQNHHQQQDQTTIDTNIDSAMMAAVGCMDVYTDPMLLQFHYSPQQQPQQQPDHEEQQQQHHHHHHHHHHQNQQQHHQLHGYAVEDTLQDSDSVNSWGMAAGG